MSFISTLGTGVAAATLAIHKQLGLTCTFSNEGETAVTLYCMPSSQSGSWNDNVIETGLETTSLRFVIATQTSFPPTTGIRIGAEIVFNGNHFSVDEWKDVSCGAGTIFRLETTRMQASVIGIKARKKR